MSIENIQKMTANIKTAIIKDKFSKEQCSQQPSVANLKSYFQKKYPKETEEEIMVRVLDYMKK